MYKYVTYFWMSAVVLFIQIFVLDNLSIAMWLRPMLFPVIVLLLPIEWRQIWLVLATFCIGFVMDFALGGSGLYIASLLPLSLIRAWLIFFTTHRSLEDGNKALLSSLNQRQLMLYVGLALLLHHTLFFLLEALSFAHPLHLAMTIICSWALSFILSWLVVRIFTTKIVVR
jgi:hypothetical protein